MLQEIGDGSHMMWSKVSRASVKVDTITGLSGLFYKIGSFARTPVILPYLENNTLATKI